MFGSVGMLALWTLQQQELISALGSACTSMIHTFKCLLWTSPLSCKLIDLTIYLAPPIGQFKNPLNLMCSCQVKSSPPNPKPSPFLVFPFSGHDNAIQSVMHALTPAFIIFMISKLSTYPNNQPVLDHSMIPPKHCLSRSVFFHLYLKCVVQ